MPVNLDEITELEDSSVFTLKALPPRAWEWDPTYVTGVRIEMDLNLLVIQRTGYNILDFLSDVGGFESVLITTLNILLGLWNYNNFDNYLVSQL